MVVNTILHVGVLHEKVEEGWKGVIRRLQNVCVEKDTSHRCWLQERRNFVGGTEVFAFLADGLREDLRLDFRLLYQIVHFCLLEHINVLGQLVYDGFENFSSLFG